MSLTIPPCYACSSDFIALHNHKLQTPIPSQLYTQCAQDQETSIPVSVPASTAPSSSSSISDTTTTTTAPLATPAPPSCTHVSDHNSSLPEESPYGNFPMPPMAVPTASNNTGNASLTHEVWNLLLFSTDKLCAFICVWSTNYMYRYADRFLLCCCV
jgi:hypothetical protein